MPTSGATARDGSVEAAEAAKVETAKTPPRWIGFASGVVAGATGVLVGHAFDTLKVQAQVGAAPSQPSGATAKPALRRVLALYRGIVPPLLTTGAIRSLYFGVFENLRATFADSSLRATVAAAACTNPNLTLTLTLILTLTLALTLTRSLPQPARAC